MSERIDIVVTDGIDGDIPKKLRDIAATARDGYTQVNQLQKAVNALQATQVNQLQMAASKLEVQLLRQMRATKQLDIATNQAAISETRAAIEKQKLDAATAQAAIAQDRQTQSIIRGQIAAINLEAAQNRLANAKRREEMATELANNAQRISNNLQTQGATNTKQLAYMSQNLLFQLNDIAVSLASGQRPLTVFLQQGSQIATMFGPGSGAGGALKQLGGILGGLATKFAGPLTAVGLFATGFAVLQSEIKDTTGVAVGFIDVVVGTFQAFGSRIFSAVDSALSPLKPLFSAVFDFFYTAAQNAIRGAAILWNFLPGVIGNAISTMANGFSIAYNFVIDFVEAGANVAIDGINLLIAGLNAIPGLVGQKVVDPIKKVNFDAAKRGLIEVRSYTELWGESITKADAGLKGLYDQIAALAVANKKAREEDEKGFNKAEEYKRVTEQLDRQIRSMRMLSDARRVQEQLDQIELNFLQNKAPLNAQETQALRERLQTIQAYARVQKETDRIVEETTGAQKAFAATLQAGTRLLNQGTITQAQYEQQVIAGSIALNQALNPLHDYEESVKSATRMLQFFGEELTAQNAVEAARQQALKKGIVLSDERIAAMLEEQRTLAQGTLQQQAMSQVYDQATGAQRRHQLTIDAANKLYRAGKIDADAYARALNLASQEIARANDPLYDFNKSLSEQQMSLYTYGDAQAVLNAQLQQYNALLAAGSTSLTFAQYQQTLMAQALAATTLQMAEQARIQQVVQGVFNDISATTFYIDNQAAMYAEIDRLRQADLISHMTAEQAKAQIAIKANEQRLGQAKDFFGAFTGLAQSGNKRIAAIGKAAAISQAIIDGILGTQKALAAFPPPFNYVAAAGVAATAAVNVASIKAQNVGNFNTGGQFTVGGRAGIDRNTIAMGVTKGERVTIETAAQQRANDSGRANVGNAPAVNVPVKVVNVIDPQEALAAMQTPEGEAVVLNILRRNPDAVKQAASG